MNTNPMLDGAMTCCGEELRPFWAEDGRLISVCKRCGEEVVDNTQVRYGHTPWIGVDLDGTLARDVRQTGRDEIGDPIEPMMDRVRKWLAEGRTVKIFTARAAVRQQIVKVKEWLARHELPDLEVTNVKDFWMLELWDDRCVQVTPNLGEPVKGPVRSARTARSNHRSHHKEDEETGFRFLAPGENSRLLSRLRMFLAL